MGLPRTSRNFIISQETRDPVKLLVDACGTGCGAMCPPEAYHMHTVFWDRVLVVQCPICELKVLNALVALRRWVPWPRGSLVHLFSDGATAVAIFQAGRGRDPLIQACARDLVNVQSTRLL